MFDDYCADTGLGLSGQGRAVLVMLSENEPDFADFDEERRTYSVFISTAAWYNGRERGFSLVMDPRQGTQDRLVITCAEIRNTDGIFVDTWVDETSAYLNPPTPRDQPEESYEARTRFGFGDVGKAASFIYDLMEKFYEDQSEKGMCLKTAKVLAEV
jgi:hypothetical protein